MTITMYAQRDPRWGERKLGTSEDTIGKSGCLLCSVAMAAQLAGVDIWPNELNALLVHEDGFESGNLLRWYRVSSVLPLYLEALVSCPYDLADSAKIAGYLRAGAPVIAELDASSLPGLQEHWVLLLDAEFHYADPWSGEIKRMESPARDIYAWAAYMPLRGKESEG